MLQITIPAREQWDERRVEFIYTDEYTIQLEHSLVSLSKWESKWCKSFLSAKDKTYEETIDYIRCMTLDPNIPYEVYYALTPENVDMIYDYINAPMSAAYFNKDTKGKALNKIITAESIYYWMISLGIWPECQHWHLNRLLALIRYCSNENDTTKMSKGELAKRNAALNAARRKRFNSRG